MIRSNTILVYAIAIVVALSQVSRVQAQPCDIYENRSFLPDDIESDSRFGYSIATDGDWLAVGAPRFDGNRSDEGAVFLYRFDGNHWVYAEMHADPDITSVRNAQFGSGISVSGDLMAVTAPFDNGYSVQSGSVTLYRRSDAGWKFEQKLIQENGDMSGFGSAVCIYEDQVLIGVPGDRTVLNEAGAVYVYEYSGEQWEIGTAIYPDNPTIGGQFGAVIESDGHRVVIADQPYDFTTLPTIYVYDRLETVWHQIGQLTTDLATPGEGFGRAIDIEGDVVVVGTFADNVAGNNAGAVYVFREGESGWAIEDQLIPSSDETLGFGRSVAFQNGILAVGSDATKVGSVYFQGSVHVYEHVASHWQETASLYSATIQSIALLGTSIALRDGTVFAGAPGHQFWQGAVYEFDLDNPVHACIADLDGNCNLDFFDVSAFLVAYQAQDPLADFNNDGDFDFFDVSAFLVAFQAGCP